MDASMRAIADSNSKSPDLRTNRAWGMNSNGNVCAVRQLFGPLIRLLSLCGIVYNEDLLKGNGLFGCCLNTSNTDASRKYKVCTLRGLYCVIISVVTWSNAGRLLGCFPDVTSLKPSAILAAVVTCFLLMSCILNLVLLFKFNRKFPAFLKDLCSLNARYGPLKQPLEKSRRIARVAIVSGLILTMVALLIMFSLAVTNIMNNNWRESIICMVYPMSTRSSFVRFTPMLVWYGDCMLCTLLSFTLLMIFYFTICKLLGDLFKQCTERLRNIVQSQEQAPEELDMDASLERIWDFHQEICNLVHLANEVLTDLVLVIYIFTLPAACLFVFVATGGEYNPATRALIIGILISVIAEILLVTCSAAWVNSKAHEGLRLTGSLKIRKMSDRGLHLVSLLVAKFSGPDIGISAGNLFVVNKGYLLTIGGILLTYFVVLMQFHPTVGNDGCCIPRNWTNCTV